ncbi:TLR adapter interacting with SLC15A4 on the lysosome-like [Ambystoma mexicanum]|uniref:TLR adapter interacting with SLC15A4 on the lysosome-like n=1 Tax=Ambystoma mexicanum TaxID=8296 RepID=UPI0037E75535
MLAEGLLSGFLYEDGQNKSTYRSHKCQKKKVNRKKPETWKDELVTASDVDGLKTGKPTFQQESKCYVSRKEEKPLLKPAELASRGQVNTPPTVHISEARHIPRGQRNNDKQLDLYTSWSSCTNICANYPDLLIGGDQVGCVHDSGCILDQECETADGPILLSRDISAGHSPNISAMQQPLAAKGLTNDEGKDKVSIFQDQPISNSLLNICIEKKLEDFYKQLLADNLCLCSSPTKLLSSSFLINNVNQISWQISQEQNIEAACAREALLHRLRSVVSGNSSEFSTPFLQISNLDGRKNLDCFTQNASALKYSK